LLAKTHEVGDNDSYHNDNYNYYNDNYSIAKLPGSWFFSTKSPGKSIGMQQADELTAGG
jgi:hypothetical protein